MTPGICMVGFGPHARRIYYKYIEEEVVLGTFQFEILIDIESKRDSIMDFLHNKVAQPKQILLCQEKSYLAPTKMDKQVKDVLDLAIKKGRIKYAIIATEPKAHKTYSGSHFRLLEALRRTEFPSLRLQIQPTHALCGRLQSALRCKDQSR